MTLRSIILLLLACPLAVHAADDRGWLGIYYDAVAPLPSLESGLDRVSLLGAASGLRLSLVFPDSPAEVAGLMPGDLVFALDGEPFTCPADQIRQDFRARMDGRLVGEKVRFHLIRDAVDRELRGPEGDFWANPEDYLAAMPHGARVEASAFKEQRILEIEVRLGERPEAKWPAPPPSGELYRADRYSPLEWVPQEELVWQLVDREGIRAETEDLFARLEALSATADPFRLKPVIFAHRNPLLMPSMVAEYNRRLSRAGPRAALMRAMSLLDTKPEPSASIFKIPEGFDGLMRDIENHLHHAQLAARRAFEGLSEEEREFLLAERWNLSDAFAEDIYIHFDEDRARYRKNQRLLQLAEKIDQGSLMLSATYLTDFEIWDWLEKAEEILRARFAGELDQEILYEADSEYGKIIIGGEGSHWYREDAAFILDLGGDDFYTANAGASAGYDLPAAICIDLAGDDAYETTRQGAQGAGCLGVGGLIDLAGDDQYIGLRWAQGVGYFGVGWLYDREGDDVYRGRSFCQGVGLFGAGILIDVEGWDTYEGDAHVQACAMAGGVGMLLDHGGDDEYYAKGLYPTGYGDEGIFDAWSQGCAVGFRTLASGGIAILHDGGGNDVMEAGNFSQGGGYYYGWGILHASGLVDPAGDDRYIGSRYNQGFAAHQALGTFIDTGGNDTYITRQGVVQGLAWDECVTTFIDMDGDDTYEGGAFFSQGASAHNSFCMFLDRGGRDVYDYAPGPARAGGNDYHGGTSLSLFIDEGGRDNEYIGWEPPEDGYGHWPEHGFWLDLEGSLLEAAEEIPAEDPRRSGGGRE